MTKIINHFTQSRFDEGFPAADIDCALWWLVSTPPHPCLLSLSYPTSIICSCESAQAELVTNIHLNPATKCTERAVCNEKALQASLTADGNKLTKVMERLAGEDCALDRLISVCAERSAAVRQYTAGTLDCSDIKLLLVVFTARYCLRVYIYSHFNWIDASLTQKFVFVISIKLVTHFPVQLCHLSPPLQQLLTIRDMSHVYLTL